MSSTNRGATRHPKDYYVTPVEEINIFLHYFDRDIEPLFAKHVLDPSAGGDKNTPMSYPCALSRYSCNICTIDIREDSPADIKTDYLTYNPDWQPDIIITNPPFNLIQEFILKSLELVEDDGYVIMLTRLNYFGSLKRRKFWKQNMPKYCYVHSKRMSFTPDGKTDSIEYCHLVWKKGENPEYCQLKVI